MDSLKNVSESRNYYLVTLVFTLILILFFFLSASDDDSPAITYTTLTSRTHKLSQPSSQVSEVVSQSYKSCTTESAAQTSLENSRNAVILSDVVGYCDLFDGHWVVDEEFDPIYETGSCPFIDDAFSCIKNGRPDTDYLRLKWKPHGCEIPRFNGLKMLKMLMGKRMVFVGDSLNRNMWESLVCAMRESLEDKTRVFEISGRRQFRSHGFYSFRFKDFNCSIDFIKSPFLVQEWKFSDKAGTRRETLRLDVMEGSHDKYSDADIIIFNTGHWWTHQKTFKGKNYFQEGNHIYTKLEVEAAYKKALKTWARWVDANINSSRTQVFFRGYSASHFKGGRWNSGGGCDRETQPITNETHLAPYPWMMRVLESVMLKMKTPVLYLNITKMTDYRKDGHPSIYRRAASERGYGRNVQDCSHWCLPGVPDTWNELLYAILVQLQKKSNWSLA